MKKWMVRIAFILAVFPIMSFQCYTEPGPDCHQVLTVTNRSDVHIFIDAGWLWRTNSVMENFDIDFYESFKRSLVYSGGILPGQSQVGFDIGEYSGCLEGHLEDTEIVFYIFDAEILRTYSSEELAAEPIAILERRVYTLQDFLANGPNLIYR